VRRGGEGGGRRDGGGDVEESGGRAESASGSARHVTVGTPSPRRAVD
jgi:hypothetical protein